MKLNLALLGLVAAQSGDYEDRDYDSYDVGNKKNKGFGGSATYTFNNFAGRAADSDQALALSCWDANAETGSGLRTFSGSVRIIL